LIVIVIVIIIKWGKLLFSKRLSRQRMIEDASCWSREARSCERRWADS